HQRVDHANRLAWRVRRAGCYATARLAPTAGFALRIGGSVANEHVAAALILCSFLVRRYLSTSPLFFTAGLRAVSSFSGRLRSSVTTGGHRNEWFIHQHHLASSPRRRRTYSDEGASDLHQGLGRSHPGNRLVHRNFITGSN